MFVLGRTLLARRLHWWGARQATPCPEAASTLFEGVHVEAVLAAVRSDGLYPGLCLPPAVCAEIASFALATPCFGNFDRHKAFLPAEHRHAEQRFGCALGSGHYFERILDCAAVLRVQSDPLLARIAALYLGGQARVIRTRVWWTFPAGSLSEADLSLTSLERFHFDLDDWRTLKFFFYILPVAEGGGEHAYLRGSHKKRLLKHQFSFFVGHPTPEILQAYGAENLTMLTGRAGFGFAEDPFGFHMGRAPTLAPRLMMEIGFGVSRATRRGFHNEPVVR